MNRFIGFVAVLFLSWPLPTTQAQTFNVLHSFTTDDQSAIVLGPTWELALVDSTLYGTTGTQGNNGYGTIFQINTDSSSFNILHSFTGNSDEGNCPVGVLTVIGPTLYGITNGGGSLIGNIFQMNVNGSNFGVVHTFIGGSIDGQNPVGGLTLSGSTFYGTTQKGGSGDYGTIFQIGMDGDNLNVMHSFSGTDGLCPNGKLLLSGSTLFGVSAGDWSGNNNGNIFQIGLDGNGFNVLHSFTGSDGENPDGNLILIGSTLYGVTKGNFFHGKGTVFKMNVDGSDFSVLHTFTGGSNDGETPIGGLTLIGSTLYGATVQGGSSGKGTIFSIDTDNSGFNILHSFSGLDGWHPNSALTLSGSTLYGTTTMGNEIPGFGYGVIYSITVPEPSILPLLSIGVLAFIHFKYKRQRRI